MEKEKIRPIKDRKFFVLFLISIFSLLIAMAGVIEDLLLKITFEVVLIFTQIIILKNFIESFMGE